MAIFPFLFLKCMDVQQTPKFSCSSANICHTISQFVMQVKGHLTPNWHWHIVTMAADLCLQSNCIGLWHILLNPTNLTASSPSKGLDSHSRCYGCIASSLFSVLKSLIIRYDKMVNHMMPTCALLNHRGITIKSHDHGIVLLYLFILHTQTLIG